MTSKFLTDHNEIRAFCAENNIIILGSIGADGSFVAASNVNLASKGYTAMPVKITACLGNFDVSGNKLSTLEGVPGKVSKHFNCSGNYLTHLRFFPTEVNSCDVTNNIARLTLQDVLNTNCFVSGGVPAIQADAPFTTEEIKQICGQYKIYYYTINSDMSVDVNGKVSLMDKI